MSKSPVRPLCRGLSEPASESKQDEVTVIMTTDTQDAGEDGVRVADTEEESSPSPRSGRDTTQHLHALKNHFCSSLLDALH